MAAISYKATPREKDKINEEMEKGNVILHIEIYSFSRLFIFVLSNRASVFLILATDAIIVLESNKFTIIKQTQTHKHTLLFRSLAFSLFLARTDAQAHTKRDSSSRNGDSTPTLLRNDDGYLQNFIAPKVKTNERKRSKKLFPTARTSEIPMDEARRKNKRVARLILIAHREGGERKARSQVSK